MKLNSLQLKRALRAALLFLLLGVVGVVKAQIENIVFTDEAVKAICVANWDTNGDGELNYDEAAAVTSLGTVFRYETSITSFDELQYFTGLTSIGNSAFYYCRGLTSVEIPNSVTSIGNSAFSLCTSLTSIEIPNSVTSIGNSAFSLCTSLTSIEIPNSVTSIGNYAFSGCTGLTTMVVASDNTTYDSRDNCNAIIMTATNTLVAGCKNTLIPNSVTSIGNSAFYYCSGLTSVEIGNSVTSIGYLAFYDCSGLTTVEIPNSVTSIGSGAFYGCTGLATITSYAINPPTLGSNAFPPNAYYFAVVYVPNGSTEAYQTALGWSSFIYIEGFYTDEDPINFADPNVKSICVAQWDSNGDGELSYGEASAVTSLGVVFKNTGITSFDELVYFTALTSISNQAFVNCLSLASISIPEGIASLGEGAFSGCSGLNGMAVYAETPPTVTSSFNNVPVGIQIRVPCSTVSAYQNATGWSSFTNYVERCNISFASVNVKAVCVAYWDTDGDGELSYDEAAAVTNLGLVFKGNTAITSFDELQYFTGLTSIGDYAFQNCTGLASVEIPNTVIYIGNNPFSGCSGLTTMVVASGNTTYDSRDNCNAIIETATNTLVAGCKNTLIPNSVISIGERAFHQCTSLTSVEIPNSVTSIGDYAFYYCPGLTSVEIPNSVTSIGNVAFQRCTGLTSVEIGNSVTYIGDAAFSGCTGLTSMTVFAETPPSLDSYVFSGVNTFIPVYVPCEVVEAYTNAAWGGFSNFIGMCGGTVAVSANPTEGGTVLGGGTYEAGQTCTLTATANEGFTFVNWTKDGTLVSTNAVYTFPVIEDVVLVANFEESHITQTANFNQGWTWWSTYIEQSGINGLTMLENELGTNGLTIKSQSQFVNYNPNTNKWTGSLKSISNEGAFMIRVGTACEVSLTGAPVNPADHPITLNPGWTWIGYPVGATMSVSDAFANITPNVGDQVKSQSGFATYNGTKWSGSLKNMEPGKGYMYKSNSAEAVILVYPNGAGE